MKEDFGKARTVAKLHYIIKEGKKHCCLQSTYTGPCLQELSNATSLKEKSMESGKKKRISMKRCDYCLLMDSKCLEQSLICSRYVALTVAFTVAQ